MLGTRYAEVNPSGIETVDHFGPRSSASFRHPLRDPECLPLISRHRDGLHWMAQNIRKSLRYFKGTCARWTGGLDVTGSFPALRQCLRADLADVGGCHQGKLPIQGTELELNPAFLAGARDVTRRVLEEPAGAKKRLRERQITHCLFKKM